MIHRIFALGLALLVVIQPLGCFRQELGPLKEIFEEYQERD